MEQSKAVYFHNAYINADEKELDRLWKDEAPNSFIKFYPAKYEPNGVNYFLEHLNNKTLWLSSPSFFNDPFDSVINFDCSAHVNQTIIDSLTLAVGEEQAKNLLSAKDFSFIFEHLKSRLQISLENDHRIIEESIYTACFADVDNLKSLRMWGYYANCHTGVCAEYSADDVKRASPFQAIPIKYTNNYNYIIDTQNVNENVSNYLKLYTKSSEWEYEKEWRVSQKQEYFRGNGYNIEFALPKKIYLGCKISNKLKKDIQETAKDLGIELFQMTRQPGSFCLDATKF